MASGLRNFLAINDPDPKEMTIVEHLEELRRRLIICIAVVTAGSFVGWFFKESAFNFLTVPLKPFTVGRAHHVEFILTKLTDAFVIELKISIAIGVALVLPVLLYQTWMFVAPAISVQARHYAVPFVLLGIGLFIVGTGVGYAVFPRVVQFLVSQQRSLSQAQFLLTVGDYVSQFALVMLIFGAVSSRFLRAKRRYAGMIGLVVAMIITPGADPITPFVTAAVVYLLYEFSIILVRAIHR